VPKLLDVEHQLCGCWCWAAVAVSIANFFYPNPGTLLTQGRLAHQTYHARDSESTLSIDDCCNDPCVDAAHGTCNLLIDPDGVTLPLQLANITPGKLQMTSVDAARDQDILSSLRNGLPVCAAINWSEGTFHFVAIVGAERRAGTLFYYVSDPLHDFNIVSRNQLETAYLASNGNSGGRWTGAYFTSKNP
jgi:hypothetical protein